MRRESQKGTTKQQQANVLGPREMEKMRVYRKERYDDGARVVATLKIGENKINVMQHKGNYVYRIR